MSELKHSKYIFTNCKEDLWPFWPSALGPWPLGLAFTLYSVVFSSYRLNINGVNFGFKEYDAACSNWFVIFLIDVVLQWLVLIGIAAMIATRNGKILYRFFTASNTQSLEEIEMKIMKVSTIQV